MVDIGKASVVLTRSGDGGGYMNWRVWWILELASVVEPQSIECGVAGTGEGGGAAKPQRCGVAKRHMWLSLELAKVVVPGTVEGGGAAKRQG